jgi:hypothetical protein
VVERTLGKGEVANAILLVRAIWEIGTEAWRHIKPTRDLGATGSALNVVAIEEYDTIIGSLTVH